MTNTQIQHELDLAASYLGYHEGRDPNGNWNNQTVFASDLSMADLAAKGAQGASWCFLYLSFLAEKTGLRNNYPRGLWVPDAVAWAKANGLWSDYPGIGAWPVFGDPNGASDGEKYRHIGLTTSYDANTMIYNSGNTNNTGNPQGDGVYSLSIPRRSPRVRGYIYPKGIAIQNADPARQAPPATNIALWMDTAFGFNANNMSYDDAVAYFKRGRAAGYSGAFLYLSNYPTKNATVPIVKAALDTDYEIAFVFENKNMDGYLGGVAGHDAAVQIKKMARAICDPTPGMTFLKAYDRNDYNLQTAGPARDNAIEWTKEIHLDKFLSGGYGDQSVANATDIFDVTWKVQTWGTDNSRCNIMQRVGSTIMPYTDTNEIRRPFPAMKKGSVVVNPQPPITPPAPMPLVSVGHMVGAAQKDAPSPNNGKTFPVETMRVERALQLEGLLKPQYVDGSFGTLTIQAYSAWQRSLGYTGTDANGIPGLDSLTKLGAKHGFIAKP